MPNSGSTAKAKPAVGLFAKPPVPGEVKTRLTPPFRPEQAAALYSAFLADEAAMLGGDARWDWYVYSTDPGTQEATWPPGAPRPREFRPQIGSDLGERMAGALTKLLAEGRDAAVLVGSDHPTLPGARIQEAFDALHGADVVLGPTQDGGYYLVGLAEPLPGLFDDIPWSTEHVLARTILRIRERGVRMALLAPWYDVDEPRDLAFLRAHLEAIRLTGSGQDACPRTWELISRLDPERLSGS